MPTFVKFRLTLRKWNESLVDFQRVEWLLRVGGDHLCQKGCYHHECPQTPYGGVPPYHFTCTHLGMSFASPFTTFHGNFLACQNGDFFVIGQTLSSTTLCQHWEWFHKDCADSIFSRQFLITWFFVNLLYSNTIWSLFFHAGFCLFCRQNARNTPARSYSESHKQLKTSCLLFQNMLLVQVHGNTGVAARLSTYMEKISRTSYEREGFYTRSEYNWKTTPFCKNEMV